MAKKLVEVEEYSESEASNLNELEEELNDAKMTIEKTGNEFSKKKIELISNHMLHQL